MPWSRPLKYRKGYQRRLKGRQPKIPNFNSRELFSRELFSERAVHVHKLGKTVAEEPEQAFYIKSSRDGRGFQQQYDG